MTDSPSFRDRIAEGMSATGRVAELRMFHELCEWEDSILATLNEVAARADLLTDCLERLALTLETGPAQATAEQVARERRLAAVARAALDYVPLSD